MLLLLLLSYTYFYNSDEMNIVDSTDGEDKEFSRKNQKEGNPFFLELHIRQRMVNKYNGKIFFETD